MSPGEAPVDIVPYDPSWPARFEEERTMLLRTLASWLVGPIEHIGSTAVPGLSAKPVIDIMAGVATLDGSRPAIAALAGVGYCHAPYREDAEHWFCKPSPAVRTHHLHLIPIESPKWMEAIAFREYLRSHPETAADYEDLKRRLALKYRLDRDRYTDAKKAFVTQITRLALHAAGATNRVNIDDLAARFTACALPRDEWTHLAHLMVGAWHVDRYGPDEALARLRMGIRRLNESHGTLNTPTGGYHETVTRAYVQLLFEFLESCPIEMPLDGRVARLIETPMADRSILLKFYSRGKLMSTSGRAEWVDPDLAPLNLAAVLRV